MPQIVILINVMMCYLLLCSAKNLFIINAEVNLIELNHAMYSRKFVARQRPKMDPMHKFKRISFTEQHDYSCIGYAYPEARTN